MTGTTGRSNAQGELFAENERLRGDVKSLRETGERLISENERLVQQLTQSSAPKFDWLMHERLNPERLAIVMVILGVLHQIVTPSHDQFAAVGVAVFLMVSRTLMQLSFVFWMASTWKSYGISALRRGIVAWMVGWLVTVAIVAGGAHDSETGFASKFVAMLAPSDWWGTDRFQSDLDFGRWTISLTLALCADFMGGLKVTIRVGEFIADVCEQLLEEIRKRRAY